MVDVPYHTHEFTIPTASEGEIRTGLETSKAITPDKLAPVLADKADKATTLAGYGIQDAASKAQGAKADTAVQPAQISAVGFSGLYNDLSNKPVLGAAAAMNIGMRHSLTLARTLIILIFRSVQLFLLGIMRTIEIRTYP